MTNETKWREVTDPDEILLEGSLIRIERKLIGDVRRDIYLPDDRIFARVEPPKVGDVIESVDGLEGLPHGSVVVDAAGNAWQRIAVSWRCVAFVDIDLSSSDAPFTVIHDGGDGE